MKKLILLLVLSTQILHAYTGIVGQEIKLPEDYKIKGSFSGELTGADSFHVVVAQKKGQRNFDLFLYKFVDDKIGYLNIITYEKKPTILSFHSNLDVLTLIISYTTNHKDFYDVLDVNLLDGKTYKSKSNLRENSLGLFRGKKETVLLSGTKKSLTATRIKNSNGINIINVKPDTYNKKTYSQFFKSGLGEINQNEFVKNGSVKLIKGYHQNNKLLFTRDYKDDSNGVIHATSILTFDLNTGQLHKKRYKNNQPFFKATGFKSYILDTFLVQFTTNKKEGILTFYNIENATLLKSHNLLHLNIDKITKGEDFTTIEKFLKDQNKNKHIPTVTLNKTIKSNLLVRLDYVHTTYTYNFDWWLWHHHMFMMQQQQMMIQNFNRNFGPADYSDYVYHFTHEYSSDTSLQFVVNANGAIVNEPTGDTIYNNIDKRKYIDELNDNTVYKHTSSCFVKNNFRYMTYSKEIKSFTIFNKPI